MPAPMIAGLTNAEQAVFAALWKRIETKSTKNELLNAYYDGHRVFEDLGISVPPQMARVRAALGCQPRPCPPSHASTSSRATPSTGS